MLPFVLFDMNVFVIHTSDCAAYSLLIKQSSMLYEESSSFGTFSRSPVAKHVVQSSIFDVDLFCLAVVRINGTIHSTFFSGANKKIMKFQQLLLVATSWAYIRVHTIGRSMHNFISICASCFKVFFESHCNFSVTYLYQRRCTNVNCVVYDSNQSILIQRLRKTFVLYSHRLAFFLLFTSYVMPRILPTSGSSEWLNIGTVVCRPVHESKKEKRMQPTTAANAKMWIDDQTI